VVGGLYVAKARTRDALTAIAVGMAALLTMQYGTDRTGWQNPNLWGLIGSAAGFFGSMLLVPARRE
jgi:hypothetical protein